MTLPKTIDNDVYGTDISFGFDTAVGIATDAIDRLHTTATSHHRMIVCEVMGHRAGWLALKSGVAGGADVILIPEIPYDLQRIAEYMLVRRKQGKRFSIIAAAEGAKSRAAALELQKSKRARERGAEDDEERRKPDTGKRRRAEQAVTESEAVDAIRADLPLKVRKMHQEVMAYHAVQEPMATRLARHLQELTGVEARVTSLGHVQRGGVPSAFDRALCTLLGAKAADLLAKGQYGIMVAYRKGVCVPVPLEEVVGRRKPVPLDDPMLDCARKVGTCLGE
jgi:6-phosphofructokinase 1